MANLKSSKKDIRRTRRRTARNQAEMSRILTVVRAVRTATTAESAKKAFEQAVSLLDRAATKNLIHWRSAARRKSRLAAYVGRKLKSPAS